MSQNFGSAVSITAELRLKAQNLPTEAAELRAQLESALSNVNIDLGAKMVASVTEAAPAITEAVAAAMAAGAAQGMAAVGAAAGLGGGGFVPIIPGAAPSVAAAESVAASEATELSSGIMTPSGMSAASFDSITAAGASGFTLGGGGGGGGLGGRALGGFMGFMAVRRLSKLYESYDRENRDIDFTDNLTGENEGAAGGVSMNTREARRALTQFQDEQTGDFGELGHWVRQGLSNFDEGTHGVVAGGLFSGGAFNDNANERALQESVQASEKADEQGIKDKKIIQAEKDLDTEKELLDARLSGNRALEEEIRLRREVTDKTQQLNALKPGLGDQYNTNIGQPMINESQALIPDLVLDNATEAANKTIELNLEAGGQTAAAEKHRIDREIDKNEPALGPGDPNHPLSKEQQFENTTLFNALEDEKKAADALVDSRHGGFTMSGGLQSWMHMQQAGYGSQAGTDSGARRVYGAPDGGGASMAGGMAHLGLPPLSHYGLPPSSSYHNGGTVNWGHPIEGGGATHPLEGGGFGGFHPDPVHRFGSEHTDTKGIRHEGAEKAPDPLGSGKDLTSAIQTLNSTLAGAPKFAVMRSSG